MGPAGADEEDKAGAVALASAPVLVAVVVVVAVSVFFEHAPSARIAAPQIKISRFTLNPPAQCPV
jgi:hypothetical protein